MDHTATSTSPLPSIFPFIPSGQNQFADIVVMDLAIIMVVAAVMRIIYGIMLSFTFGYCQTNLVMMMPSLNV
jgi:hypothetical protein